VALGLSNTMRTAQPMAALVPDPGRANVIACGRYLPNESASCGWVTDPRGHGLAAGGT
jgi:gamma-glutamyltranspeptidase/glutathione hydrolase